MNDCKSHEVLFSFDEDIHVSEHVLWCFCRKVSWARRGKNVKFLSMTCGRDRNDVSIWWVCLLYFSAYSSCHLHVRLKNVCVFTGEPASGRAQQKWALSGGGRTPQEKGSAARPGETLSNKKVRLKII